MESSRLMRDSRSFRLPLLLSTFLFAATGHTGVATDGLEVDHSGEYRARARRIAETVVAVGIPTINTIDVGRIGRDLETVRYTVVSRPFDADWPVKLPPGSKEALRADGRADIKHRRVYVQAGDRLDERAGDPTFDVFLLHEGLLAIGYNDVDYTISTVLYAISVEPDPFRRADYREVFEGQRPDLRWNPWLRQWIPQMMTIERDGGGTGVGHGGDFDTVEMKMQLSRNYGVISTLIDPKSLPDGRFPEALRTEVIQHALFLNIEMTDLGVESIRVDAQGHVLVNRAAYADPAHRLRILADVLREIMVKISVTKSEPRRDP